MKEGTDNMTIEITEAAAILKDACSKLSAVCDGAISRDDHGFNKPDQSFGNYIALVDPSEWDAETCHVVRNMLTKYRGQLEAYGVDVDALPKVKVEWEREPGRAEVSRAMKTKAERAQAKADLEKVQRGEMALPSYLLTYKKQMVVTRQGDEFLLHSPKDYQLIDRIKAAAWQNRKWTGSCWKMWGDGLTLLLPIIHDFGFIISTDDLAHLMTLVKAIQDKKASTAAKPQVWIEDGKIATKTDYDPNLVNVMQAIDGRDWAGRNGGPRDVNYFPLTVEAGRKVLAMADSFRLRVDPALRAEIDKIEVETRERINASQAVDAEIDIEGLGSGDLKLRPFQRGGIKYAVETERCFIADEMGLGKTIQALGTLQAKQAYPALVVVPKAVKLQWAQEVRRWLPSKRAQVVSGGNGASYTGDVVIINYDILKKHLESLKDVPWKAIILDESQQIKNKKAQRSEAAIELSEGIPLRLCLSGTPLLNRPVELVNQLAFLDRLKEFGGGWKFMRRYCNAQRTRYGWDMNGASNLEELARKLRANCYVRREKKDVAKELPPLQRTEVPIEIDRVSEYQNAVDDVIRWVIEQQMVRATMNTIEEINDGTNHPRLNKTRAAFEKAYRAEALVRINGLRQLAVEHKLSGCIEWVKNFLDNDGKLVLFAHHRTVQQKLAEALADYNPATISGGDSDEHREAAKKKFWEDDSCRVMVASMQATNFGLNLQIASSVAFVEFGWHMAIMEQAEARVHRIGTDASSVNSYWLYGEGTFDEDMIELIKEKGKVVTAVNAGQEIPEHVNVLDFLEGLAEKRKEVA